MRSTGQKLIFARSKKDARLHLQMGLRGPQTKRPSLKHVNQKKKKGWCGSCILRGKISRLAPIGEGLTSNEEDGKWKRAC